MNAVRVPESVPYTEEVWEGLVAAGRDLDRAMEEAGLSLTMGAEPTYVLQERWDEAEWTVEALGDSKRQVADELFERLCRRFAPGALQQKGLGKWYPGELEARWALRCMPGLSSRPGAKLSLDETERYLQTLCERLGIDASHVRRFDDSCALVLVLGYSDDRWESAAWEGDGRLLDLPGPPGMRLPWSSLPENCSARGLGTALCADGESLFLPPLPSLRAWLELVRHLESVPLPLSGYAPPLPSLTEEGALTMLSVTPDPGVLEVNLHPAASWTQLVEIMEGLDEEARACGLRSLRWRKDGRPAGTGGGCHIVVGGPTPQESPFALRPDLLRSILVWWNRHPSLSYLFSGFFVGPTCQAARPDEGRPDTLYELELAFKELEVQPPPDVLGRIFRDLLVDVTGNGHRCEICVDKLFDPNAPGGQQGLLEFRAFEMPPHPRMNLALMLLVRGLLLRLWRKPVDAPLKRWGTHLHDRFMLPTHLWADLLEVLLDLQQHGIELESSWFEPHFDFRFPLLGQLDWKGGFLQLRPALEPWPVLGQGASSGSSRPVDSSLERLEVVVSGDVRVACNGFYLPLAPLGNGQSVAGVRFRAWKFESALHPTVDVHAPLQFDVVRVADGKHVGSCRYHVTRPHDGGFWSEFPKTREEANERLRIRFERNPAGKSFGAWREPQPSAEFPTTLDLRWQTL